MNSRSVEIDTTPAGLRAATNGDLAGAISDAEAALRTAIDATSGVGTSTVSSASSVTGSTIRLDLTDATGRPIVISDMQMVSRDAYAAGSLAIRQDISTTSTVQVGHGEYLTGDGLSGGVGLAIADGATGSIGFTPQTQRFTFTLDTDGNGAAETYIIDGVTADFATQLAAVASEINEVNGLTATVVDSSLQIANNRGDGSALNFGTADALVSDAIDAVAAGKLRR